ncbi:MAG: 23S rRNA (uracil(1939)-C(5))-methyltransferase RlmD [Clostridia bacterium]|nr:23S rRNA (uracil(1939)-C(5))-methyltransferase RlmD [Clostridia bacterium]
MSIKNQNILQKNQKYTVEIVDYGSNGEGVAKIEGVTVFVPFSIVGEKVEIILIVIKKDFAIAKIVNIIQRSPNRVDPKCQYYSKCGGCQLQHMNYAEQLKFKQKYVQNSLKKFAGYVGGIEQCEASASEYAYRNKFSFPVGEADGKIFVGMYRPASHNLVEIEECVIQEDSKPIIDAFLRFANENDVHAFSDQHPDGVKHLVARTNKNEVLVCVVSVKKIRNLHKFAVILQKKYKKVHIINNINTKNNNVILGDKDFVVLGDGQIEFNEFNLKYNVNVHSFLQVNNDIKHKLYNSVLGEIGSKDIVIDAYSGAGVLSAIIAKKCQRVYGIEIVKEAVENANSLAQDNGIVNLNNVCGDCAEELPKIIKNSKANVVVLDPPRKGCDKRVLDSLIAACPQKIIYVSCDPSTLARDLKILAGNYEIAKIKPFDMFPQTANVETLAILKLNQNCKN